MGSPLHSVVLSHPLAFSVHSFDRLYCFLYAIIFPSSSTPHISPSLLVAWPFICLRRTTRAPERTSRFSSARPNTSLFLDLFQISIIASHHPHLVHFPATLSPSSKSYLGHRLTLPRQCFLLIPYHTNSYFIPAFHCFPNVLRFITRVSSNVFHTELGSLNSAGMLFLNRRITIIVLHDMYQ